MAYTPTSNIMRRVESALEYDLLGYTDADTAVDNDANQGLTQPLNSDAVVERVERYMIDVVGAGDLYLSLEKTGITCGYSFASNSADGPETATGGSLGRRMVIEIAVIGVIDTKELMIGSGRGEQIDDIMDDVKRIFGSARRDGTNFNIQTVNIGDVQKLDGGSAELPWIGRVVPIEFRSSARDLLT